MTDPTHNDASSTPASTSESTDWGAKQKWMIGVNVLIMLLLAIGIYAGVNYAGALKYARKDWTRERLHSLSPETISVLQNLDQEVEVFNYYRPMKNLQVPPRIQILVMQKVNSLLAEYKQHTDLLVIKEIDADKDPTEARFLQSELEVDRANLTVFRFGKGEDARRQVVKLEDVADIRGGQNQASLRREEAQLVAFRGEEQFTSAIRSVLEEKPTKTYFTVGHGEMGSDDFSQRQGLSICSKALRQNNYTVSPLNLLKEGAVPGDCDVLVVAAPSMDYAEGEIAAIKDYIESGGNLFLMLRELAESNVMQVVEDLGITAAPVDVMALDSVNFHSFEGQFVLRVSDGLSRNHLITQAMAERGLHVIMPLVRPLFLAPTEGVSIEKILQTYGPQSWGERIVDGNPNMQWDQGEKRGPLTLGLAVQKKTSAGGHSRILVFGDADFAGNRAIGAASNRDLVTNSFDWLTDKGLYFDIAPKVPTARLFQLSPESGRAFLWVWWGMPIFFGVILGSLVWWTRRS